MAYQLNEPSEAEQTLFRNVAPELDASLNAMSVKDREVLTLHYLEGHSFKSISARLGGTTAAWQKRSVRALEKLSHKLRRRGVSVSVVSLGTFFAIPQAEAGISAATVGKITKHALENSTVNTTTGITGKFATLITMKSENVMASMRVILSHISAFPVRIPVAMAISSDKIRIINATR